jgi:hypothetical protein
MTDSPAARLAARKSTRPMPAIVLPREDQPALRIGNKRSVKRPHVINTPISDRSHKLLDDLTLHFRQRHGRGWRLNSTIEHALDLLAREVGLAHPDHTV